MKTDLDDIVIYPSKWKLLALLLGSLVFVAVGIWIGMLGWNDLEQGWWLLLVGAASIAFFGLCGCFFLIRLLVPKPALTINSEGITDNASALGVGFLRWEEIDDIFTYETSGQRFLGIIPKDVDSLLARQTAVKARLIRLNMKLGFPPVNIPHLMLPMKVDDLAAALMGRYNVKDGDAR